MFKCSRCKNQLPPDDFAPSQRKNGAWCRACTAAYYRRDFDRAERECESPRCGNRFVPRHPSQRFCCANCKQLARHYRETADQRHGRTCGVCGVSIDHLRLDARWCSEACAARRPAVPSIRRRSRLRRTYGLTEEAFDALLASQGGVCAICGGGPGLRGWHVDHCHSGGHVRGVLCEACNLGLGKFRDNPAALRAAAAYLEARGT